ncbi:MAG TPA: cation:proton antiporter, partial [Nitrococcus sp.]|nr:cation:proton antiporter [Nitrococcus sp.]
VIYGSFSLLDAVEEFVLYAVAGTAIGLAVGWVIARVRQRVEDRLVEMIISLFTSYAAYIPAQALGFSGVLAAVAAGLYLGWYSPMMTAPRSRLQIFEVWDVLPFLLNSVLFILIGLQFPSILAALTEQYSRGLMFLYGALISATIIGTRLFLTFPMAYLPRLLSRRLRERNPTPPWQHLIIIGYTGMRGGVSLAAALAVPLTIQSGAAFPGRALILFLTFCVILFTLVPQGVSLSLLIRLLGLAGSEDVEEREETEARLRAAQAALARLDELKAEHWVSEEVAARMRDLYEFRRRRFAARGAEEADEYDYEKHSLAAQRLRQELLTAERAALLRLRSEGRISDEIRRRVERELDLEETRLEI